MNYTKTTEYPNGTSLQGGFYASFDQLYKLLGLPEQGDGYKTSTEWRLKNYKGDILSVYDWKSTDLYDRALPSVNEFRRKTEYRWKVGAHSLQEATNLVHWLEHEINKDVKDAQVTVNRHQLWLEQLAQNLTNASTHEGAKIQAAYLHQQVSAHLATALSTTKHQIEQAMLENDAIPPEMADNLDELATAHEGILSLLETIKSVPVKHQAILTQSTI